MAIRSGRHPEGQKIPVGRGGVLDRGGKRMLGSQPVVEDDHRAPGGESQPAPQSPVAAERSDAVAAAVEVQHHRSTTAPSGASHSP